jgi:sialidase-1
VSRPIYPVLIRNEHGPLLRVVIDVPDGRNVALQSLTIALDGTDDLTDIDSLTLFSTGDQDAFSASDPVGDPHSPAQRVTFDTDRDLQSGRNVFWLACRLNASADLVHHVALACPVIETTAGVLTPRDDAPDLRHRIGVAVRKHNDDGVHTYRILRSPRPRAAPCCACTTCGGGWDAICRRTSTSA